MAEPHRSDPPPGSVDLRNAFCAHYRRLLQMVDETMERSTDSVVLARLGDSLDELLGLVNEVSPVHLVAENLIHPCFLLASQHF
jgi:hypothetical protein